MSLRFFHIVFIALAAVLAAAVGIWSLRTWIAILNPAPGLLLQGVIGLAAAVALAGYAVWYVRKTRGQSLI